MPDSTSQSASSTMDRQKSRVVPLEEALAIAGTGLYTHYVMLVTGLTLFAAFQGMQVMSYVIPAAGCDLGLSIVQKGVLTSMAFSGMIFSSHLFGFLADACGRKRVMLTSNLLTTIICILSSLAPNAISLMIITFISGFVLGGIFTPAYVYVSEFCPQTVRARGLLVATSLSSMATVYLPCLALVVMPLELDVPLVGGLRLRSWRLYLALLSIPNLATNLLLQRLPETPKYLLNAGRPQETLEVLRSIYAVNTRRSKDEYPVEGICLDPVDEEAQQERCKNGEGGCSRYMMQILAQTVALFKPPFLSYTLRSCVIFFGIVGAYNTIALWIPELTRELMSYSETHEHYKATLCEVMSSYLSGSAHSDECEVNQHVFFSTISIGLLQSIFFCCVSILSPLVRAKILIGLFGLLSAAASFLLTLVDSFILSLSCLGAVVVLLLGLFPICLSLAVDFYPTSLRSTATSIIMLFGRTGAATGSQLAGAMFLYHCQYTYWFLSAIITGVIIICIGLPSKRI